MLLMSFGLIKSPCPVVLSKDLLLSERAVPEHTKFSLAEGCLETSGSVFDCDQRRVLELRAHGVMLVPVLQAKALKR